MAAPSNTWRRYFATKTKWTCSPKTQDRPRRKSLDTVIGQEHRCGVLIRKAHLYRLYPTPEQAATLWAWIGAVRCVYNLALEQRRDWYRPGRKFNVAT
ncbi:helix-turn-helix domain-containing protein [Belnapia moabensis]|uniref:helix-turn-helix domain-containing protein n=1 Tax=Belnapia moabensis TaxID=365533 RepID=UPI0012ECCD4D